MHQRKLPGQRKPAVKKPLTGPEQRTLRSFSATMNTTAFRSQLEMAYRQANLTKAIFNALFLKIGSAKIQDKKRDLMLRILEGYRHRV